MTAADTAKAKYIAGYSDKESDRLNLQHEAWVEALGGALSPRAKEAAKAGRIKTILELACGTGVWSRSAMKEMQQLAPAGHTTAILATDVAEYENWSDIAAEIQGSITFLANISVLDNDSLSQLKQKYTGGRGFDLVHFRHIAIFMPGDKWVPFVDAAVSLVAPQGLLQHETMDSYHCRHTLQPPLSALYTDVIIPIFQKMGRDTDGGRNLDQWMVQRGMSPVDCHLAVLWGRHSGRKAGIDAEICERNTLLQQQVLWTLVAKWLQIGLGDEESRKKIEELKEALNPDKFEYDDRGFARMIVAQKTGSVKDIF